MQHLQATPITISHIYSKDARQWLDISGLQPPQRSLFPHQPKMDIPQPSAAPMLQYQQLQYQQYIPPPPPQQQQQQQPQQPQQQQKQQQQQQQQQSLSGTKRNHFSPSNPDEEQPLAPKKPRLSSPLPPTTTTTNVTPAKRRRGRPTNASKGLPTKRAPRKSESKTTITTTTNMTGQNQAQPPCTTDPAPQAVPYYPGFQPAGAGYVPQPVAMVAASESEIDAGVRAQMAALEEEEEAYRAVSEGLAVEGEAGVVAQEDREDSLFGDDCGEGSGAVTEWTLDAVGGEAGAGANDDDDKDSLFGDVKDFFE
ncbi:hypothetical protein BM1_07163 [Bipolaris maydis]|nr:hypothetical protein BM1_07163 [Bipolaris maydis]KAJ6280022.1 hypothetical protein J3E71DRAFT_368112 [Bipolaris maydis]